MSKKLEQSKQAKKDFQSLMLKYDIIGSDRFYTKEELQQALNTTEREVRREIAKISNYYPIISKSNSKGYRLAKPINELENEILEKEIEQVNNVINELQSRITQLKAKMKPLIAWKIVAEKKKGK